MPKLIYTAIMSLDGYTADKDGNFSWAAPDEEVHRFINEIMRPVGTYLYGRRMYGVMSAWQAMPTQEGTAVIADFANIWRAAEKVVYSSTLKAVSTPKTRIERQFDRREIERLKASAQSDLAVGGPTLAAHAFHAGLIDVCHLFIAPVMVGSGTSAFPDGIRPELTLQDERRFQSGMIHLHYRARAS